jgi:hypothetical protein
MIPKPGKKNSMMAVFAGDVGSAAKGASAPGPAPAQEDPMVVMAGVVVESCDEPSFGVAVAAGKEARKSQSLVSRGERMVGNGKSKMQNAKPHAPYINVR